MPEHDLPPVLDALGDDLDAAMQTAEATPARRWRLGRPRAIAVAPRRASRRSVGALVVGAVLAAVAILVVVSLGGSRATLAQAAVLKRAAAALDQPNTILYVQVHVFGDDQLCVADGPSPSTMCIGTRSLAAETTGTTADPANDKLSYSSQEWLTSGGGADHTIYSNGNETAATSDAQGHRWYSAYNAANNTLWTLSPAGAPNPPPTPHTPSQRETLPPPNALGTVGVLSLASNGLIALNPSYIEDLYREARNGRQSTFGPTTITPRFVGPTSIGSESAYELRFDIHFTTNPFADDKCASSACPTPADQAILLYIDGNTFMPVRSVLMTLRTSRHAAAPPAATVTVVRLTNFDVRTLPNTTANQALLQMSPHPSATRTQSNYPTGRRGTDSTASTGATGSTS